jgi:hypothetical protein
MYCDSTFRAFATEPVCTGGTMLFHGWLTSAIFIQPSSFMTFPYVFRRHVHGMNTTPNRLSMPRPEP